MRLVLLISLFFSFWSLGWGQNECVISHLGSQKEIDDFPINYPNCEKIKSQLTISGSDITDLQGLSNIKEISAHLSISENPILENLYGLNNLEKIIGNLLVNDNPLLNNLEGLENLSHIQWDLQIINNETLKNFEALNNELALYGNNILIENNNSLKNLDGLDRIKSFNGKMKINRNDKLTSLVGLNNINRLKQISIFDNDSLLNLNGLNNLDSVELFISISDNELLTNIEALENIEFLDNITIRNNASLKSLFGLHNIKQTKSIEISYSPEINSLEGLNGLERVEFTFTLSNNPNLQSFKGLDNLIEIGEALSAERNPLIKDMMGLEKLKHLGGIYFRVNHGLEELEGLVSLESMNSLFLQSNENLTNITALKNLRKLEYAYIVSNDRLVSLDGLQFIDPKSITNRLTVLNNDTLSFCHFPNICEFIKAFPSNATFVNNHDHCTDNNSINSACQNENHLLYVATFIDLNEDGILQQNEPFYPNSQVEISPISFPLILGNTFDLKRVSLLEGDYVINFIPIPDWELTSSTMSIPITLNSQIRRDTVLFGIVPKIQSSAMSSHISSNITRCNENSLLTLYSNNLGTTFTDGIVWIELDSKISNWSFLEIPDTTDGNQRFGWKFENLPPGHSFEKQILINIPGPPEITIGDNLNFESYVEFSDGSRTYNSPKTNFFILITCSYDPNDKLVAPDRNFQLTNPDREVDYTLFEEDLFYTIRFQNTGNDVAYDVSIRDTLDENLDPSTLQILSSSHYELLNTSIENDRYITFEFKDIFLPDSTANFDASQGYVSYLIRAKDGITENTPITNSASIYFDQNPPIVTNTTENIMVSELPTTSTQTLDNQLTIHLFPNPTSGTFTLSGNNLRRAQVTITDLRGRTVLTQKLNGAQELTLPGRAPTGMYFVRVETEEGFAVRRIMKE